MSSTENKQLISLDIFRGLKSDFNRRKDYYISDWVDGLQNGKKSLSAILFLYFACLAPIIAFGGLTNVITDGYE